jgi:hypothetical protein
VYRDSASCGAKKVNVLGVGGALGLGGAAEVCIYGDVPDIK